jgi:hypothetical protein
MEPGHNKKTPTCRSDEAANTIDHPARGENLGRVRPLASH